HVRLGELAPDQVIVEAIMGRVTADGSLENPRRMTLKAAGEEDGTQLYKGRIPCNQAGRQGIAVRLLPNHPDLVHPFVPGFVRWL
ncbi:MAG: hypothetical protein ACOCWS_00310, partial [Alkalispirochaetaceae bacterium]